MTGAAVEKNQGRTDIHPLAKLLRGFAVDFLTCHDLSVVPRIMAPDYCLHIGGHVLSGRDSEYLPATAAQLRQFPGLCVTVHDVVLGTDGIAMQFTEHGASYRDGGRSATWRGVTLFRTEGERLRVGWAEEDYFSRKVQLVSGVCDTVDVPCPTPWDGEPQEPDPAVEETARHWLLTPEKMPDLPDAHWISAANPHPDTVINIADTTIDTLFSAGDRVAFHLQRHGTYAGGFEDIDNNAVGTPIVLRSAGLLTIRDGQVVAARITSDRLGLYRSLRHMQ